MPDEQPVDHYRLLGLPLFEGDAAVICAATDRQLANVQSFQGGEHDEHAQKLLQEIAAAKCVLLRAEEKSAYDARLKSQLEQIKHERNQARKSAGAIGLVLPIVAVVSRYQEAFAWTRQRITSQWSNIALASDLFDFTETDYYQASMGTELMKCFFACEQLIDPANLADLKRQTNEWEAEYARATNHDVARPLNLDPGYIHEGKLVLASTKDHSHRIYLRAGIYAEVTLHYKNRAWQSSPWTYPDYQREDFQAFFTECRENLKACRRKI